MQFATLREAYFSVPLRPTAGHSEKQFNSLGKQRSTSKRVHTECGDCWLVATPLVSFHEFSTV